MDIIFGSVSAEERQAHIARQEKGGFRSAYLYPESSCSLLNLQPSNEKPMPTHIVLTSLPNHHPRTTTRRYEGHKMGEGSCAHWFWRSPYQYHDILVRPRVTIIVHDHCINRIKLKLLMPHFTAPSERYSSDTAW